MLVALVRSPVTIDIRGSINGPLTEEDACRIGLISDDISHNMPRHQTIKTRWSDKEPCVRDSTEKEAHLDRQDDIDSLYDLQQQEVLVLVAMSGGGSRAAALAAHTMSLLEKAFNRLQKNSTSQSLCTSYRK